MEDQQNFPSSEVTDLRNCAKEAITDTSAKFIIALIKR